MNKIAKIVIWTGTTAAIILLIFGVLVMTEVPLFELVSSLYQSIVPPPEPAEPPGETPQVANYYLNFEISEEQVEALAKYDVISVDMEAQHVNPERIEEIRELNDDIVILAYITSEEIRTDANQNQGWNSLRHQLYNNLDESWWLKDTAGNHINYWPDTWMINPDTDWADYLANFMHDEVMATGLWDGIVYDNVWTDMGWLKNDWDIDMNNDGQADSIEEINTAWTAGMTELLAASRNLDNEAIIITNGPGNYSPLTNGRVFENFPNIYENGYVASRINYLRRQQESCEPVINIINSNVNNGEFGDETNYQRMRFGLTTTLMADGYYSFDRGEQTHHETWWYDAYEFDLGTPTSEAYIVADNYLYFQNFSNGAGDYYIYNGAYLSNNNKETVDGDTAVVKNSSGQYEWNEFMQANANQIQLDANQTYTIQFKYRILENTDPEKYFYFLLRSNEGGYSQDVGFNSWNQEDHNNLGEMAAVVTTGDYDDYRLVFGIRGSGKIAIDDIYITSGDSDAHVWQRDYTKGSVLVNPTETSQHITLECFYEDREGNTISQVTVPSRDGVLLRSLGRCPVTIPPLEEEDDDPNDAEGKETGNSGDDSAESGEDEKPDVKEESPPAGETRIVTAPGYSGGPHIREFSDDGVAYSDNFYAFPAWIRSGARLATGDIDKDNQAEIITGTGIGTQPHVKVYEKNGAPRGIDYRPFPAYFRGGVDVAAGDIDGDGKDEVITSQFTGGQQVKIYRFNAERSIISQFSPFGAINSGVTVTAGDIDNDGRDEVITGASQGGGPHIRVFDIGDDGAAIKKPIEFMAFSPRSRSGIDVAAADIDNDGKAEIGASLLFNSEGWIKVYRYNSEQTIIGEWRAFPPGIICGANLEMFDLDKNGQAEVLVGPNIGGGPQVRIFSASGYPLGPDFFAYSYTFRGGVIPAAGYF